MGFSVMQPEVRFGQNDVPSSLEYINCLILIIDLISKIYLLELLQ
jgi:hypothetical protein